MWHIFQNSYRDKRIRKIYVHANYITAFGSPLCHQNVSTYVKLINAWICILFKTINCMLIAPKAKKNLFELWIKSLVISSRYIFSILIQNLRHTAVTQTFFQRLIVLSVWCFVIKFSIIEFAYLYFYEWNECIDNALSLNAKGIDNRKK